MFDVVAGETVNARHGAQGTRYSQGQGTGHEHTARDEAQGTGHKEQPTSGHEGIEIQKIYLPFTSRGIVSVILNLLYLLKYRKGIFHITGDVHYALLVLPRDRTILTIHDLVFLHTYKGIRRATLKWIFLDLPIRRAKYITTISEKSKQEIIEFSKCDPEKIIVIQNPVYTARDEAQGTGHKEQPLNSQAQGTGHEHTARDKGQGTGHEVISSTSSTPSTTSTSSTLLFLGTKSNKNLESTIAALFGLDVHLRIIGKLDDKQLELLKKFKINYSNAFNISDEQLHQEYDQADILLFPSTYEGFGLPVIEGFQFNTPVITSNIAPMCDVAQGAALLVDPYSIDSIRKGVMQLIHDEKLKYELVEKGREVVKQYQPSSIAARYAELWRKIP